MYTPQIRANDIVVCTPMFPYRFHPAPCPADPSRLPCAPGDHRSQRGAVLQVFALPASSVRPPSGSHAGRSPPRMILQQTSLPASRSGRWKQLFGRFSGVKTAVPPTGGEAAPRSLVCWHLASCGVPVANFCLPDSGRWNLRFSYC